ncbi:hypothetical protein GCM10011611_36360 [Aliidongia dinghuensis]|uniref:Uncharacterized protein n=1 Tax=Aliidongia dinghuensis TaxID=1867774 RepID=A0A8J2YWS6_9PROT|nr:hypothetical protein GCM10011611_36360 [Aliidongia dinghuensis]
MAEKNNEAVKFATGLVLPAGDMRHPGMPLPGAETLPIFQTVADDIVPGCIWGACDDSLGLAGAAC